MTFSIVARSADCAHFGVAIASSSPAVAARCARAIGGIGATASQNVTDPSLGPLMLTQMQQGRSAGQAIQNALESTPFGRFRQLLAIGRSGPPAAFSGAEALGVHASCVHEHCAAAGNLLASAEIPQAMVAGFLNSGPAVFAARLLAALRAGLEAGGEAGPIHSAGLLVVRDASWPLVDLRVDWDQQAPLDALEQIWNVYAPQMEAYVQRARDPSNAPGFGVPGER